jgi:hypothetical protein
MEIYRILYRGYGRDEWWQHTGRAHGTRFYGTLAGVKAAITRLKKENARYNSTAGYEYKVQVAKVDWNDFDAG